MLFLLFMFFRYLHLAKFFSVLFFGLFTNSFLLILNYFVVETVNYTKQKHKKRGGEENLTQPYRGEPSTALQIYDLCVPPRGCHLTGLYTFVGISLFHRVISLALQGIIIKLIKFMIMC